MGYLKPSATGSYSFKVEADDGVRVTVNGQILIDSMIDAVGGASQAIIGTPVISLVANELVPIHVQYYQATGQALIALYWQEPGQSSFAIIGSPNLYHKTYP